MAIYFGAIATTPFTEMLKNSVPLQILVGGMTIYGLHNILKK
ncbi:MAG: hypothetical protein Faunusvirus23_11, partial [Faunusvirus sp.]